MPNANTDDAIHPEMVNSIMANAFIGEKPPNSIPQNSKGSPAKAKVERLAMVGDIIDKRLVRINGVRAFHCDAPFPNRKSYCARLRLNIDT